MDKKEVPCPLVVMDESAVIADFEGANGHANKLREARAAVAELVEADLEYDEARLAMNSATTLEESEAAWDRSLAAFNRRAAALAKFKK